MQKLSMQEMSSISAKGTGCRDESTCGGCLICMVIYGGNPKLCMMYAPACQ